MKGELWRYSRRELNNALSVSGDEQFRSIILMVMCRELDNVLSESQCLISGDEQW